MTIPNSTCAAPTDRAAAPARVWDSKETAYNRLDECQRRVGLLVEAALAYLDVYEGCEIDRQDMRDMFGMIRALQEGARNDLSELRPATA